MNDMYHLYGIVISILNSVFPLMEKLTATDLKRAGVLAAIIGATVSLPMIAVGNDHRAFAAGEHFEKKLGTTASVVGTTYTGISGISITGISSRNADELSTIDFKYFASTPTGCTNEFWAREVYVANSAKFFMTEINGVAAGQTQNGSVSASTSPSLSVISHDYWLEIKNTCSGGSATVYAGSMQNLLSIFE